MSDLLKLALAAIIAFSIAGCSSHRKAQVAASPDVVIKAVDIGDEVLITSKNGKLHRFIVTRMTNKALYGDGYKVTYGEMSSFEIKKKAKKKKDGPEPVDLDAEPEKTP